FAHYSRFCLQKKYLNAQSHQDNAKTGQNPKVHEERKRNPKRGTSSPPHQTKPNQIKSNQIKSNQPSLFVLAQKGAAAAGATTATAAFVQCASKNS
ncbi:hypothetical protein THAOC_26842, partial [Thalassiosira oceanica]